MDNGIKSKRLKQYWKETKLSQICFSEKYNIAYSTLRKYLTGEREVPEQLLDSIANGDEFLKEWLLGNGPSQSAAEVINRSMVVLNSLSAEEMKWQDTITYILKRNNYTMFDVGASTYPDFIEYMDGQIRYSIETYIKYFKEKEGN